MAGTATTTPTHSSPLSRSPATTHPDHEWEHPAEDRSSRSYRGRLTLAQTGEERDETQGTGGPGGGTEP